MENLVSIPRPIIPGLSRPGYVPIRLYMIMQTLLASFKPVPSPFRLVDAFSGKGAIARGFQEKGQRFTRLDLSLDERDAAQLCIPTLPCAPNMSSLKT